MTWRKMRRNSFRRIQRYQHNYCLLSLTGCLGCRWKRYQQSKKSYTWCDNLWCAVLLVTFTVCSLFLFFWLTAANERTELNYVIFYRLGFWYDWYYVIRSVTIAIYTYLCFLVFVSLLHVGVGYQLYIHHVHRVALVLIVALCIVEWALFYEQALQYWTLAALAVKIYGPYMQIGFVWLFTVLSWLVAGQVWKTDKLSLRLGILALFAGVMTVVYLAPLMSSYPCVCSQTQLPNKPRLLAHRGASALAPENTMVALTRALDYNASVLYVDVSMTADDRLYAFHDQLLTRTTNVAEKFPENVTVPFREFTSDQINQLRAGPWFLKYDPYRTVSALNLSSRLRYQSQTVPPLTDVLDLVRDKNVRLLLDVTQPPGGDQHARRLREEVAEAVEKANVDLDTIYWVETFNDSLAAPNGTIRVISGSGLSVEELHDLQVSTLYSNYRETSEEQLRLYRHHKVALFVHLVNVDWLLSYFWCVGVAGVMTDNVHHFVSLDKPTHLWNPQSYLILWILSDCVSVAIITVIFIAQYLRRCGGRYVPDVTMSLRPRGQMKEKLLYVLERPSPKLGIDHRIDPGERAPPTDDASSESIERMSTVDGPTSNLDTSLSNISIIMDKY